MWWTCRPQLSVGVNQIPRCLCSTTLLTSKLLNVIGGDSYTLGGLEAGLPIKAYHLPALPVQEGLEPKWAQPGLSLALWDLYHNIYIYVGQAEKECNAVTAKFNRMGQYRGSRISVRRRHNPKPAAGWASIDFTPLVVPTPGIKINYLIRLFQSFHLSINSTFVLQRHEK